MAAINVTQLNLTTVSFLNLDSGSFSLIEFITVTQPLLMIVFGIAIYAVFIFKFYRFLARRDIIKLKLDNYAQGFEGFIKRFFESLIYVLENLIIIPLLVFFWFAVLAVLMVVISKNHTPELLLLTSMGVVGSVRVAAYYNENLSQDLAKMIPFALLGVFLVDITYFSFTSSLEVLKQLPTLGKELLYFLLFVIGVEFIMRILHGIIVLFKPPKELVSEIEGTEK